MQIPRKRPDEKRLSRSSPWRPFAVLTAAALVIFGCSLGGQTGTELTPPKHSTPPVDDTGVAADPRGETAVGLQCDLKSSVVALDSAKALGFSAEDVLSMAEGTHEASVAWRAPASFEAFGATGTFGPENEDDRVTLTITHDDGEVRLVRFTPKEQKDAGATTTDIAMPSSCPPSQLEVDVSVKLNTSGGAFDESFDAVLVASDPLVATLNHQLARDELDGSFAVKMTDAPSGETITVGPVELQASIYSVGTTGTLSSFIDLKTDSVAGRGTVQFAHWPADDPCTQTSLAPAGVGGVPVSLGAAFDGTTPADVLTDVESVSGIPITWTDDSDTTAALAVSARGSAACLLTSEASPAPEGAAVLRIPVDVALETADGRVDAVLPGMVDVTSGTQSEPTTTLTIAATLRCESDDRAAACGWPEVDAVGYDALRVDLSLETEQPASASTVTGTIRLTGITTPECLDTPPPPEADDGGGMSSSGCAGEQRTEIEIGAMGAP